MRLFKTLIVEDNQLFRQTIADILSHQFPSMVLEEAAEGKEAFQKIQAFCPDLIFMDIKLPGENGLQLTERIKKQNPQIIVAILTSYDWPEYREAAFKNGANYFMMKGSSTNQEIVDLVESILKDLGFDSEGKRQDGRP